MPFLLLHKRKRVKLVLVGGAGPLLASPPRPQPRPLGRTRRGSRTPESLPQQQTGEWNLTGDGQPAVRVLGFPSLSLSFVLKAGSPRPIGEQDGITQRESPAFWPENVERGLSAREYWGHCQDPSLFFCPGLALRPAPATDLQPLLCRKLLKGREKSVCGGDLGKGDPCSREFGGILLIFFLFLSCFFAL